MYDKTATKDVPSDINDTADFYSIRESYSHAERTKYEIERYRVLLK